MCDFAVWLRFLGSVPYCTTPKCSGEPPGLSEVHLIMVKFSVADSSSGPLRMRTCAAFLAEGTNWAEMGFERSKPPVKTVIASVGSSLFIFTPQKNCAIDDP